MRVKLVTLRFAPSLGAFDDRPLDAFLSDKKVLAVREHFFVVHDLPHLACLVTYSTPTAAPAKSGNERGRRSDRPDPTADLTDDERPLFQTLREWRAARARKDGVPPYVILTNRELVAVVRARPTCANALRGVEGIGDGKFEKYGQAILARVNGASGGEEVA